jgi:hypothetical protein
LPPPNTPCSSAAYPVANNRICLPRRSQRPGGLFQCRHIFSKKSTKSLISLIELALNSFDTLSEYSIHFVLVKRSVEQILGQRFDISCPPVTRIRDHDVQ